MALNMKDAEVLTVNNYGIGGMYEPHPDYFEYAEGIPNPQAGDRISTVMLYVSIKATSH